MKLDDVDKKQFTEAEIRSRYITPGIRNVAGWNWVQIGEEITLGMIIVRGKAVGAVEERIENTRRKFK